MKKFLSVALAAVMMLSLAACGSSSNKAESSSEGGSASDKTYIIATDTTFAPFEFTNDKNEFVGIDVVFIILHLLIINVYYTDK